MNRDEVLKLANLVRIKLTDAEAEKLSGEFDSILGYVGEIKEISSQKGDSTSPEAFPVRNIMRSDSEGHEGGIYSEKLLDEAPENEKSYVKVKKIL
jgi:aspartyl-tRNA(Asn)/glutamyl-tRNA(Gln) amidotransferase subunit C